jgi:glycine/D-amino acid oxidase-like deaminating enzyme
MTSANRDDEAWYRSHSFWLDSVPGSLAPRPSLEQDIHADVVIVGAGYTGLWTAWYLHHHAPDLQIVVLEAEIAGFGASGRNGGWCTAYLAGLEPLLRDPRTRAEATGLQHLMIDAVAETGRVCNALGIDTHFEHAGHVTAAVLPVQERRLRDYVAFRAECGFGEEHFRWLDADALGDYAAIDGALGGYYTPHCAAIHPARLARGLAAAVAAQGTAIHERSPVTALLPDGVGTEHGRVRAEWAVLATEGYTGSLPGLKRKLIPVHSMMVATEPLTEAELASTGLTRRVNFNNDNHVATYGQLTADRRIAFGCRGGYLYGGRPRTRFDAADPEFRLVEEELLRLFPGLRGKRFTHAWGGSLGVSRRLRPSVGADPSRRVAWAGGYFGDGVAAAHLAGRTLADLLLDRDTERSRAWWVNRPDESELDRALWVPEPLRWLGVATGRRLMGIVDAAERRDSPLAPAALKLMEWLFP